MMSTVSPLLIFILARCRGFFSFCFVAIFIPHIRSAGFSPPGVETPRQRAAALCTPASRTGFILSLQDFWRERNDTHKVSLTQLAGYRAKDTCASWVVARRDNDSCVFVETNMRAIGARVFFRHAHHDRVDNLTLFYLPVGSGNLDGGFDNIPHLSIPLARTAHHPNAHNLFRTGVVGDLQACLWLNHDFSSSSVVSSKGSASNSLTGTTPLPRLTISISRQRFNLLNGRLSSIRTVSPIWQLLFSSCA